MLFIVLVLAGAGCGKSTPKAAPKTPSPSPTATGDLIDLAGAVAEPFHARYAGTTDAHGSTTLPMTIARMNDKPTFSPTVIIGSPGERLTIDITNTTPAAHTFTIASLHIDVLIGVGEKKSVTVTLPSKDNLIFYCRFHAIDEPLSQAGEFVVS
jgi:hypothetical protein